jgi:hypothetical protein
LKSKWIRDRATVTSKDDSYEAASFSKRPGIGSFMEISRREG